MMKRYKLLSLCMIFFLSFQGCSAFKSNTQTVSVICQQPETALKINGDFHKCPAKADVRRNNMVIIEATKEGYNPFLKKVDYHIAPSGIDDIIGTVLFLFPIIGLMSPGAWDLDETEFNIELLPILTQK